MDDDLSCIFWAHRPDDARPAEAPDLSLLLAGLCRGGCAAWPGVLLPEAVFVQHLARHAPAGEATAALQSLHSADLYLACACSQGIAAALQAFDQVILRRVPEFLAGMNVAPDDVDEVRQVLRTRLLVKSDRGPAKIGDYSGRGSLLGWARVIAIREAINLKPRAERERRSDDDDWTAGLPAAGALELDYLKARYKTEFEQALREAVAELTGEQRTLLRLHHRGGLSSIKLAAMYQVNQSTASRWLKECHQVLQRQTEALLCQRTGLSPSEFESLTWLVRSQLHLSLAELLPEDEP